MIRKIDENDYKYLGVLEAEDIFEKEMKEKLRSEFFRRVKLLAQSKLCCGNTIKGINSCVVSVIYYTAGIIDWTAKELKTIDIRTRKVMTMAGMFHLKGDVDRLYLMRKDGERGMISVEDCMRTEEKNWARYIMRSKERLFGVVTEGIEMEGCGKEYKKRVMVERKEKLKKK